MPSENETLLNAKASMRDVYQRKASVWHAERSRTLYEKVWLGRFIDALPSGGSVLDLGCGAGDPVARYFLDGGFEVSGIDYSPAMIEIAKNLFPNATWQVGDMRILPDVGMFDGIYSWDAVFHLSVAEQRAALPQITDRVKPGGALMLTVGPSEGEVTGTVGGEAVYHASLSPAEYDRTLRACGFRSVLFKAEDPDCQGRSVLFASAKAPSPDC